jgi:alpha-amylase
MEDAVIPGLVYRTQTKEILVHEPLHLAGHAAALTGQAFLFTAEIAFAGKCKLSPYAQFQYYHIPYIYSVYDLREEKRPISDLEALGLSLPSIASQRGRSPPREPVLKEPQDTINSARRQITEGTIMHDEQPKKVQLILALHNHQPEGNLPEVFERTYTSAYEPFIRELEAFPNIRVVQHYSGILLRWLQENRPEFMSRLRNLVASGQVEMMGGAFYEPILVMIPDEDKIGQIKKQTAFIQANFQTDVAGAWLAERIWEPHLARPLALAGIRYTVLDDAHFRNVGFAEEDTLHYFVTEESGERVSIFPISEKLRYTIPFAEPEETINYLRSMATTGGERVVVLADDGEKFGSWPGTAKLVYEDGWLRRFFELLSENSHWLEVTTFASHLNRFPAKGRVYLPAGSYREMMEWSGGFWRNFFVRYPESNQIHKKMLHVREKLAKLPESAQKREAQEYLWAGQCNCAYWHGIFGGLYLNFLRSALYSRLIAAETLTEKITHGGRSFVDIEKKDFDYDGIEELIVSGPELGFILAPETGGAMLELDFKPKRFNLFDVLTRRREPYHCNIFELGEGHCATDEVRTIHHITQVKEAGLADLLVYDAYRRASLIDHFFPGGTTLEQFSTAASDVEAGDFVGGHYQIMESEANGAARIVLARDGNVCLSGQTWPVRLGKTVSYIPRSGEIRYDYSLVNTGTTLLDAIFAVEFNINLLAGQAPDRYYTWPEHTLDNRRLDSRGELTGVKEFGLVDEWQQLSTEFQFHRPATLWRMPLETVSQSEEGMERVYQGSTVMPTWQVKLHPGEPWILSFSQKVTELIREVH